MISIEKDGRYYHFISTKDIDFPIGLKCSLCSFGLSEEYSYVIFSLKNHDLLLDGFIPYCCNCNAIMETVKNNKCPQCYAPLGVHLHKKFNSVYIIHCTECKYEAEVSLP